MQEKWKHIVVIRPEQEILGADGNVDLAKLKVVTRISQPTTCEQILVALSAVVERLDHVSQTTEDTFARRGEVPPLRMGRVALYKVETEDWVLVGTNGPQYPSGNMIVLVNGREPMNKDHTYHYPAGTAFVWVHCWWVGQTCAHADLPYDKAFYCQARQTIAGWLLDELEGGTKIRRQASPPLPDIAL